MTNAHIWCFDGNNNKPELFRKMCPLISDIHSLLTTCITDEMAAEPLMLQFMTQI